MPIFTFPKTSDKTSDSQLEKYYNINLNKTKENMINTIKSWDYIIDCHRIDIGGYYIPSYLGYESFIKTSDGDIEHYITTTKTRLYKLSYSTNGWFSASNISLMNIPEYDRLRSYILFIEQYRHLYCMTQYLINNHILMDDIVTHMLKMNTGYVFI